MKKRILLLVVAGLLLLPGCRNKKQVLEKPENLIGRSTMVKILAESYIIESTVYTAPDTMNKVMLIYTSYKELFNRYNITREQFVSSMDYYVSEESTAEKLLSDASDYISREREKFGVDTVPPSPSGEVLPF